MEIYLIEKCLDSLIVSRKATVPWAWKQCGHRRIKAPSTFVVNVQSNDHYQMLSGIPSVDLNGETERFREL